MVHSNDAVASIRLLHHPPDETSDERQLGAGTFTDFGAIALLLQEDTGGLQVWDGGNRRSVDIKPSRNAYVVNVGHMLQMWTSGKYKSNLHRAVNRGGSNRYSVPFVFDGNVEYLSKPLDGSEAEGKHLTVEQPMKERFASTYGRGKRRDDREPPNMRSFGNRSGSGPGSLRNESSDATLSTSESRREL